MSMYTAKNLEDIALMFEHNAAKAIERSAKTYTVKDRNNCIVEARIFREAASILRQTTIEPAATDIPPWERAEAEAKKRKEETIEECKALMRDGKRVDAIGLYRMTNQCSLRQAILFVDKL